MDEIIEKLHEKYGEMLKSPRMSDYDENGVPYWEKIDLKISALNTLMEASENPQVPSETLIEALRKFREEKE